MTSLPLHRFTEFGTLTPADLKAVAALADPPKSYDRGRTIRGEGEIATGFYLLFDGWAVASATLPDGGRQILKLHLPGDALGTPSMSMARTAEALTAITPCLVATVSFERFGAFIGNHARLAAHFLLSVQRERVALMDRLASIGRTSAGARLAAFLLDLAERLTPLGAVTADRFQLQVTQEQIGDLIGLTSVHVNRTMRELEDDGLVARDGRTITILDRPQLARLAARPTRQLREDLSWLP